MSLKLDQNGFKNQLPHWIKPGARPKLWKSRGMAGVHAQGRAWSHQAPGCLKPGGRVAVLTFHSGEDRRVKKAFQAGERNGTYAQVAPDVVRASFEERRANPRATSAKLRWAVAAA